MKKNYWYVSNHNEILVDMDKPQTSMPHAEARLAGAIHYKKLYVRRVEIHESFSPDHVHLLITLNEFMPALERIVWGILFHGDIYRGLSTIMRLHYSVPCADLLITPQKFLRAENAICSCEDKHTAEVMDVCPAAIALRGDDRTRSFFGAPIEPTENLFGKYSTRFER